MKTFWHAPPDKLDYSIDWVDFLEGDTISASDWEITSATGETPPLLVLHGEPSMTPTKTTIWVDDGTLGQIYVCSNTIVTALGREATRELRIKIVPASSV